jgi:hypothetical protein
MHRPDKLEISCIILADINFPLYFKGCQKNHPLLLPKMKEMRDNLGKFDKAMRGLLCASSKICYMR